jgi:ABC-2 type transport system ATP-binding protein
MSGLDPIGRKEIRDIILRLRNDGKTVFMNTHILSDVEMVCDRVAIIVEGRIRYDGRIEDFLAEGDGSCDLVLSGVTPEAVHHLEEHHGVELRGHGDRVELSVKEKDVGELLRWVIGEGAEVLSLTPHRVSLESIFMDAVREDEEAGQ